MIRPFTVLFAICFAASASSLADVKLPGILSDNMVLQQGMPAPIWGTAAAGEKVTVKFAGQEKSATADEQGKWIVKLDALAASDQPVEMTVIGANTIVVKNILIGEVWVGSGQSNMDWTVNASATPQEEIAAATYPKIRLFIVRNVTSDKPLTDVTGKWWECSPQNVPGFSAVAYYFGRHLHKELNGVPVGLIRSSWGGTPVEGWLRREVQETIPGCKPYIENWDKIAAAYPEALKKYNEETLPAWEKAVEEAKKKAADAEVEAALSPSTKPVEIPKKPNPPPNPEGPHRSGYLYNGMIAPLMPFAIKGVIWYQGESNAGNPALYAETFPAMITDWRKQWGEGDFPFLFVQLANYMARKPDPSESNWAGLRESQAKALALPDTGMAVAIDIGDGGDIHPKNKQDVGKRLALAALHIAYHKKGVVYSGPTFESMSVEGDKARVRFQHVDGGLVAKGDTLKGFAIAGEDKKFFWADAKIDGDTVVLYSPQVNKPSYVRYAWADNPEATLYNQGDLPAVPFRTDK